MIPIKARKFRPNPDAVGDMDANFHVLEIEVWGQVGGGHHGVAFVESNHRIEAVLCRDDMVALRDRITEVLEATQ